MKNYYVQMTIDKGISYVGIKSFFALIILAFPFGIANHYCTHSLAYMEKHATNTLFIIVFSLLFNIYFTYLYGKPIFYKYKSKNWKKATAYIQDIHIFKVLFPLRIGEIIQYFPNLYYRYIVDKKVYYSDNISFEAEYIYNESLRFDSHSNSKINKIFDKWIDKRSVEIFYNPKNPNESVIFKNFHPLRYMFYIFMTILSFSMFIFSVYDILCWSFIVVR